MLRWKRMLQTYISSILDVCYKLMGTWFPIFRQVDDNYRFGGARHTDPALDQKTQTLQS
jgi:hypothetical protein